MGSVDHLSLIQKLDALITHHKMLEAKSLLDQIHPKKVPDSYASQYANLAVRMSLPDLAIRFLWNPIFNGNPTEEEFFQYASALRKLGLVNQSLKMAERFTQHSKYHLHKAFAYIARWEYRMAAEHLEEFLKSQPLASKDHSMASVNLAAAKIFLNDFDEAERIILSTMETTKEAFPQLYLNQLELLGQLGVFTENLDKAASHLKKAQLLCGQEISATKLFVQKWQLLLEIKQGKLDASHNRVLDFLSTVRKLGHWETLRDWDLQSSLITHNTAKLAHSYFGSPFNGFRHRKILDTSQSQLPNEYFWIDPRSKNAIPRIIDLHSLEPEDMAFGKTTHRLIMALASDFYRPWSVERIFDVFFEEEFFNPFSSRKRIYKHLGEVKSNVFDLPVEFKATASGYRLRPNGNGCLVIKPEMIFSTPEDFIRSQIETHFGLSTFSKEHLAELLSLNPNQVQRHLKILRDSGSIQRIGLGRGARYRIKAA